ncbi:aminotransferase class IV [Lewinella sp. JB7]|uniref:aminotransferase class IV n=1 Tax=Lewinella sp. JB7 TaxID=2962887 RepID=UPI0020C95123|nr:aminotransferase class IV [Lewinella sp. JB7]MCP9237779.1 aminotransferase class IV [Lewinella sp. JB7]
MLKYVYVDGDYRLTKESRLHVSDLSILRGYGVFDYFRYLRSTPRFLPDHLARLRRSAAELNLEVPLADEAITEIVAGLIERNGGGEGGIRLIVTGGYAADGYTPRNPNFLALPNAHTAPPADKYVHGCAVMLHSFERQLPRAKTIDYLEGIRILPLLRQAGADYPVYVDREDNVRESDRSNVMIVRGGTLITPVDNILLGITRKHLLALAGEIGIPCEERPVAAEEFRAAEEALICSTVKGPMPIGRIDGLAKPVGPVTRRLIEAWRTYE